MFEDCDILNQFVLIDHTPYSCHAKVHSCQSAEDHTTRSRGCVQGGWIRMCTVKRRGWWTDAYYWPSYKQVRLKKVGHIQCSKLFWLILCTKNTHTKLRWIWFRCFLTEKEMWQELTSLFESKQSPNNLLTFLIYVTVDRVLYYIGTPRMVESFKILKILVEFGYKNLIVLVRVQHMIVWYKHHKACVEKLSRLQFY